MDRLDTSSIDSASADVMLGRSMTNLFDANEGSSGYGSRDELSMIGLPSLTCSPHISARSASSLNVSFRPSNYANKAKVNSRYACVIAYFFKNCF